MSDYSHSIRAMAVVNTPVIATVTGEEKGRRFEKRIKKKGQRTVSTSALIGEFEDLCAACVIQRMCKQINFMMPTWSATEKRRGKGGT